MNGNELLNRRNENELLIRMNETKWPWKWSIFLKNYILYFYGQSLFVHDYVYVITQIYCPYTGSWYAKLIPWLQIKENSESLSCNQHLQL